MVMVMVRVRVRRLPGGGGDRIVTVSAWPFSSGGREVGVRVGGWVMEGRTGQSYRVRVRIRVRVRVRVRV